MKSTVITLLFAILNFGLFAQAPGTLDLSFDPGTGTNGVVEAIAVQSDGQILIGGVFGEYNGTVINGIARLNTDGTLDTTFNPGAGVMGQVPGQQYHVYDIAIQADGKIILVGGFYNYDNTARNRIVRINTDGSLDATFDPGAGASGTVRTVEIQSDGKIVIGGSFQYYDGFTTTANRLVRLNTDGSRDFTFDIGTGANSVVRALDIQSDGKILIGGDFTDYDGTTINRVARVNTDGSIDNSFDPGAGSGGTFPAVQDLKVLSDSKIIVAGYFDTFDGVTRGKIVRLNADGSLDSQFDPGTGADLNAIHKIAVLSDNDIIIVGSYYEYDGTSRNSIARIDSDGALDIVFDPGTGCNNTGEALALQSDEKVLIGGNFDQYDGTQRDHIARVHNGAGTSSVNELLVSEKLFMYPNPSNGVFTFENGEPHDFSVYDLLGNKVLEERSSKYVDLTSQPDGVYTLRTANNNIIRLLKH